MNPSNSVENAEKNWDSGSSYNRLKTELLMALNSDLRHSPWIHFSNQKSKFTQLPSSPVTVLPLPFS